MHPMRLLLIGAAALGGCSLPGTQRPDGASRLAAAEAFVDAFYSFDPARLSAAMAGAPESLPRISYYQGWAEGGNYTIVQRMPCRVEDPYQVSCSVTVRDDLIQALGTGLDVTDTFEFDQAMEWVQSERADLVDGPCRDAFEGGTTPGECVRAMVQGFREYAARRRG